jgi:hypothetical protein
MVYGCTLVPWTATGLWAAMVAASSTAAAIVSERDPHTPLAVSTEAQRGRLQERVHERSLVGCRRSTRPGESHLVSIISKETSTSVATLANKTSIRTNSKTEIRLPLVANDLGKALERSHISSKSNCNFLK